MSAGKDAGELRRRAEARLAELRAGDGHAAGADVKRLLHEVRVHQVELELQNEELQRSRLESEMLLGRYTELFDFAPIGFFHIAQDGTIAQSNFAGARLLGTERRALTGRAFASFVAEHDRSAFEGLLTSVLTRPEGDVASETGEFILWPGASEIVARVTGALLPGGGPLVSALLSVEDVTAWRKAEDALRAEGRHKDEFLTALSHELRNPLAPIRNAVSVLQRVPSGSDRATSALAVVDRQLSHLTRIVDDLLDVTRIARGKARLHVERLELGDLVRRIVEDHEIGFRERGVRLRCEVAAGTLWIDADASRIAQVIGNLLGNAIKFTNPGDHVEVVVGEERDTVVLRVRDSGVGISPEIQRTLFEPFSQAPQTLDRSRGGLGLGLATVKGIVVLHGGTIGVSSAGPGRGSEFVVRLPLALPGAPAEAAASNDIGAAVRPLRVLVIEDYADAAYSLKDMLELRGHEVRVAPDGRSGIFAARAFRPEVVLCDIGLPGISGHEVARTLRSEEALRDAFLVALSGYASSDDAQRAAEAGFDRHLAKPATPEQLEALLAEAALRAR